jgi:hypothetical protein
MIAETFASVASTLPRAAVSSAPDAEASATYRAERRRSAKRETWNIAIGADRSVNSSVVCRICRPS